MAKEKEQSNAVTISHFAFNESVKINTDYFVEADENGSWVQVGGPFNSKTVADGFAKNYAIQNHVSTRVVIFQ